MRSVWLWVILVIALGLRAALFSAAIRGEDRAFTDDSYDYAALGQALADYGSFPAWTDSLSPGREIFRTPGYPSFLALGLHFRRPLPKGLGGLWVVLAVQVLIDLHLVLVTYWLGREVSGHAVGLLAAGLQAISPLAVGASCRVLSDGLFAFLLAVALLLMVRHLRTGSWRTLLPAAAVLGAACYVRPVGLAFSAVVAMVLLFRPKRFRRAAAFAGVVAACVAPWVARNALTADYVGFSSFATDSMYWYSAAELVARKEGVSPEQARVRLRREEGWDSFDPDLVGQPGLSNAPCYRTPGGLARYRWRRARQIVLADPWTYLDIHLTGSLAFWLPGATDVLEIAGCTTGGKGTLAVLHEKGLAAAVGHYFGGDARAMVLAAAMAGVLLLRYVGVVLCGLWKLRPRVGAAGWLMVLLVAAAFLLPGPAGHPRFRVPVAPILSVAAAIGWLALAGRVRRRPR